MLDRENALQLRNRWGKEDTPDPYCSPLRSFTGWDWAQSVFGVLMGLVGVFFLGMAIVMVVGFGEAAATAVDWIAILGFTAVFTGLGSFALWSGVRLVRKALAVKTMSVRLKEKRDKTLQ